MSTQEPSYDLSLSDLRSSAERVDPSFVQQFLQFLAQPAPPLPDDAPDDAMRLDQLHYQLLHSYQVRRLPPGEERMEYRQELWHRFLQQDIPLPPRLALDQLVLDLYGDNSEWSRQILLTLIAQVPLVWGPWRGIKRIFKRAEDAHDLEMLGAIAVRCDLESSDPHYASKDNDVTLHTLHYLRRRGWRYLRHLGQSLPELYPSAAVQFLRWYPDLSHFWYDDQIWNNSWILNHIFYHEYKRSGSRVYGHAKFKFGTYTNKPPSSPSKHRAFPKLWEASPDPLLDLLLLCRSDKVASFAVTLLHDQFASQLRDLPLAFLIRLGQRAMPSIQRFVKDWIDDNPTLQKASFRDNGLHNLLVEHFLLSEDDSVRKYAVTYARDYARDLSLPWLIRLAQTDHSDLHDFVHQLLRDRDARDDIGLDHLQTLLQLDSTRKVAQAKLEEGFRPGEIPLDWFKPLLFSHEWDTVTYTIRYLEKKMPAKHLSASWYQELLADSRIKESDYGSEIVTYALNNLAKLAPSLSSDWIQEALLHDSTSYELWTWIESGKIKPSQLDLSWFQALTSASAWNQHPWVQDYREREDRWVDDLSYPQHIRNLVLAYLGDTEYVAPQTLGLEWLLSLLQSGDRDNVSFARDYLLEHFHPEDFATDEIPSAAPPPAAAPAESPFAGKSVLFTGKLQSLSRKEAQAQVKEVGGIVAKSVTQSLDYLVVGDEGSPLFAGGKKGSKLVKAEKLQAEGLPLEIISETDWLRMVSEGSAATAEVDPGRVASGFQRLLAWATTEDQSDDVRQFAVRYLQERHPQLGPEQLHRPLKGHESFPRSLYQREPFLPLFADERASLQDLAVAIGRYELRQWEIPPSQIFLLCESPYRTVRRFAIEALLGPKPGEKEEPFHYPPDALDPALVFALCESRRREVRHAGLTLLQRHYDRLDGDQQILRLAESPDRDVRTAAVRMLWGRYRRPSIAGSWSPRVDRRSAIPPRGALENLSDLSLLLQFARMVLFGLPPGKMEQRPEGAGRPWSNSKAKVHLIDVLRDLALEDQPFAVALLPLLEPFLASHHKMETLASLTALTQIRQRWNLATYA